MVYGEQYVVMDGTLTILKLSVGHLGFQVLAHSSHHHLNMDEGVVQYGWIMLCVMEMKSAWWSVPILVLG